MARLEGPGGSSTPLPLSLSSPKLLSSAPFSSPSDGSGHGGSQEPKVSSRRQGRKGTGEISFPNHGQGSDMCLSFIHTPLSWSFGIDFLALPPHWAPIPSKTGPK